MDSELKKRELSNKWFWMDNDIFQYGHVLEKTGLIVYVVLCRYANAKTQTCNPSLKCIAENIGASSRIVSTYIQLLAKWKLIKISRTRVGYSKSYNKYLLLDKSMWVKPQKAISSGPNKFGQEPEEKNDIDHRKSFQPNKTYIKQNLNKECSLKTRELAKHYSNEIKNYNNT